MSDLSPGPPGPEPSHDIVARPPVGLIGVGLMGQALVRRLSVHNVTVTGFDIVPENLVALKDMANFVPCGSAREVLQNHAVVILSLPTHRQVQEILTQYSENFPTGAILVDTTTGDPQSAETIAGEVRSRGASCLDATISGNSEQLERGDVVWMVGGDAAAVDQVSWLFQALGREHFYTGPVGSGAVMKLVTNLVLGLNRAALAEGLAFAEACELDLDLVARILKASAAYSRIMDSKLDKMLQHNYQPQARLSQHHKDVRLIRQLAANHGMVLPLSAAHQQILQEAERLGLGGLDNSALFEVLRRRSLPHE